MKIAVGECPDVARGLSDGVVDARILPENVVLAQYGHDNVILDNLYRPSGNEVERDEHVPLVHQSVAGWRVGRLELHGERAQTAGGSAFECGAVVEQVPVQMDANVSLKSSKYVKFYSYVNVMFCEDWWSVENHI